ncbi:MAG: triose-phosphate isomerase [Christensenellaceae bacterium]
MTKLKKLYIGTNTKMYKTITETESFLSELNALTSDINREELFLFVIPSFTTLDRARNCVPKQSIVLGAQNMCWEERGQFTGEVSPLMLKEVGVEIVEIGHSERRQIFFETDEMENKKLLCALKNDLTPLLCIGETAEQKAHGLSDETLKTQLKRGLFGAPRKAATRLMIAYEPVWAIGVDGVPATSDYVAEKHDVIREALLDIFGCEFGRDIPILFGGSVNNENATKYIALPNVDGLFVGRSAWDSANFNNIIRGCLRLKETQK